MHLPVSRRSEKGQTVSIDVVMKIPVIYELHGRIFYIREGENHSRKVRRALYVGHYKTFQEFRSHRKLIHFEYVVKRERIPVGNSYFQSRRICTKSRACAIFYRCFITFIGRKSSKDVKRIFLRIYFSCNCCNISQNVASALIKRNLRLIALRTVGELQRGYPCHVLTAFFKGTSRQNKLVPECIFALDFLGNFHQRFRIGLMYAILCQPKRAQQKKNKAR